ncbi:MAG: TldD/PmbA family protein [Armatimonadota bacterium]
MMDYRDFANDIVEATVRAGAHEAEVYLAAGDQLDVDVRMGRTETVTRSTAKGLGLRVFVDKRMSFASTTDFEPGVVRDLVRTTVALAKQASRDRFNGLPEGGPGEIVHLELFDPAVAGLSVESAIEMALATEGAAFDFDPRITNSHGAGFGSHSSTRVIANSNGILYESASTDCGLSCAPMAEANGEKQIGHYWSSRRYLDELDSPTEVGRQAAARAVRRLGARKVATQNVPVIFDWSVGGTLFSALFAALDGDDAHRGLSFLRNKLGKKIASPLVTVIDDPHRPRGVGSMSFDGEGVLSRPKIVVDRGVLCLYFYDARTARKYRTEPTGNARRGYSGVPSVAPANFYLKPSETPPGELLAGVREGFYVTETMGHGANVVTGDFSVGASGLWISGGEVAFPVEEVTISGNMLDMLKNIEQVANDARFISSIITPTFKISEMTVSGS